MQRKIASFLFNLYQKRKQKKIKKLKKMLKEVLLKHNCDYHKAQVISRQIEKEQMNLERFAFKKYSF